jgi:hypothetical protein
VLPRWTGWSPPVKRAFAALGRGPVPTEPRELAAALRLGVLLLRARPARAERRTRVIFVGLAGLAVLATDPRQAQRMATYADIVGQLVKEEDPLTAACQR